MAKAKEIQLRKLSLADAASEAFGEIESLAEEMRSWADNMEEKFSSTDKYARVSECADTLENFSDPGVPDEVPAIDVEFADMPPKKRGHSRSDRCGQACYIIDQCIQALQDKIDEIDNADSGASQACETLMDELDQAKNEWEGCDFPGMFG